MAVRTQVNGCRTKNSTTWGNNGDIVYTGATRPRELRTEYFTPSPKQILKISVWGCGHSKCRYYRTRRPGLSLKTYKKTSSSMAQASCFVFQLEFSTSFHLPHNDEGTALAVDFMTMVNSRVHAVCCSS